MKERGIIKVSLSVVICISMIDALLAVCGSLFYFGFIDKKLSTDTVETSQKETTQNVVITNDTMNEVTNKTMNEVTNEIKQAEPEETAQVIKANGAKKIDESKDWIYGEKRQYGTMPRLNIDSDVVKMINEEIERACKSQDQAISTGADGDYKYNYYINGNYISLVLQIGFTGDYIEYYVYNIDKTTGNTVSNLELINYRGLTINSYVEKLKNTTNEKYSNYESRAINYDEKHMAEVLKNTNNSVNTPLFLGEDGKIDAVIKLETFAGKGDFYFVVDVE